MAASCSAACRWWWRPALELEAELSVLVARRPSGETRGVPARAQPPREAASSPGRVLPGPAAAAGGARRRRRSPATWPTRSRWRGCWWWRCSSLQDGRAAGERARAAAAQHVPRHRGGVPHQPVRAGRARGVRPAAGLDGGGAARRRSSTCSATCGWATRPPRVRPGAGDARRAAAPVRQARGAAGPEDGAPVRRWAPRPKRRCSGCRRRAPG